MDVRVTLFALCPDCLSKARVGKSANPGCVRRAKLTSSSLCLHSLQILNKRDGTTHLGGNFKLETEGLNLNVLDSQFGKLNENLSVLPVVLIQYTVYIMVQCYQHKAVAAKLHCDKQMTEKHLQVWQVRQNRVVEEDASRRARHLVHQHAADQILQPCAEGPQVCLKHRSDRSVLTGFIKVLHLHYQAKTD